jgi:hypothetical protein
MCLTAHKLSPAQCEIAAPSSSAEGYVPPASLHLKGCVRRWLASRRQCLRRFAVLKRELKEVKPPLIFASVMIRLLLANTTDGSTSAD